MTSTLTETSGPTLAELDAIELAEIESAERAVLLVIERDQPATATALHDLVCGEFGYYVDRGVVRAAILRLLLRGDLTL